MTHQPPFDRSGLKCRFPTSCTGLLLSPGWSKEEEQESNKDEKLSSLSQTPHPPHHTPPRPHYQSCFRCSHHCNHPSLTSLGLPVGVRSRPQQYSLFFTGVQSPNYIDPQHLDLLVFFCQIPLQTGQRQEEPTDADTAARRDPTIIPPHPLFIR